MEDDRGVGGVEQFDWVFGSISFDSLRGEGELNSEALEIDDDEEDKESG